MNYTFCNCVVGKRERVSEYLGGGVRNLNRDCWHCLSHSRFMIPELYDSQNESVNLADR